MWTDYRQLLPHEVLNIAPDATEEEIRRTYHKLILRYHPDRNSLPDAASRTQEITEAYQAMIGRHAGYTGPRFRKQSAKYHRKDPQKKGRAARKAARKASKKHPVQPQCQRCGGSGTITETRTLLGMMKRSRSVSCPDCAGKDC